MINQQVYEKLKEVARRRGMHGDGIITYTELNEECNLNLNYDVIKDRNEIAHILGEISKEEYKNNRPLLSAVVVLKGSHPPVPAFGFFNLMEELKLRKKGESKNIFFVKELVRVQDYWRNR